MTMPLEILMHPHVGKHVPSSPIPKRRAETLHSTFTYWSSQLTISVVYKRPELIEGRGGTETMLELPHCVPSFAQNLPYMLPQLLRAILVES